MADHVRHVLYQINPSTITHLSSQVLQQVSAFALIQVYAKEANATRTCICLFYLDMFSGDIANEYAGSPYCRPQNAILTTGCSGYLHIPFLDKPIGLPASLGSASGFGARLGFSF